MPWSVADFAGFALRVVLGVVAVPVLAVVLPEVLFDLLTRAAHRWIFGADAVEGQE